MSIRTLRRDVDRLRELGYPVLANRGVDGGYQLEAAAAMPPLLRDDDQAVALAIALQTAAHETVASVAESSLQALAKLTQVMPPRLRHRIEALRAATDVPAWSSSESVGIADPQTLVTVAVACRDSERLRFAYASAEGDRTQRRVEPLRLVSLGRRWYLIAYDLDPRGLENLPAGADGLTPLAPKNDSAPAIYPPRTPWLSSGTESAV